MGRSCNYLLKMLVKVGEEFNLFKSQLCLGFMLWYKGQECGLFIPDQDQMRNPVSFIY